jgi:hypothetical protein
MTAGSESQGACRQDELIAGKPPEWQFSLFKRGIEEKRGEVK